MTSSQITDSQQCDSHDRLGSQGQADLLCTFIKEGVIKLDSPWQISFMNPEVEKLFTASASTLLGKNLWDTLPELSSNFYKPAVIALKHDDHQAFTGYYAPHEKNLSIRLVAIDDGLVLFINDITEHTLSMRQISDRTILLDGVKENILEGIVTIDQFGIILTVNPAIERMMGYHASELIGNNVSMMMGGEQSVKHDDYLKSYMRNGEFNIIDTKHSLHARRKDGSYFQIELSISKMLLNNEPVFIGGIYDVTERLEQEAKIRELARFLEESWNPVLKISAEGVVAYANSRCGPILTSWQTSLNAKVPDHVCQVLRRAIDTASSQSLEVESDSEQYFSVLFAPTGRVRVWP